MNPKPANAPPPRKRWWQAENLEEDLAAAPALLRRGESCPQCQMADLDFDTLFRLHCPVCGFVASCGAFT